MISKRLVEQHTGRVVLTFQSSRTDPIGIAQDLNFILPFADVPNGHYVVLDATAIDNIVEWRYYMELGVFNMSCIVNKSDLLSYELFNMPFRTAIKRSLTCVATLMSMIALIVVLS